MAELLKQWLNEEVGLSKRVDNFEEDFASGYLLGELLYKFNQQTDFEQFSTKNATSHFVMNFEKLEPTLRALKIQFNSRTVEQIMKQERGLALRVLYQIKMVLEKVYPPADISIVAKTGKFGDNQPAQKIVQSKPKYDEVSHEFFKQRLAKLNRAQKEIDLEIHVKKFDDEKVRQADQAAKLDKEDRDEEMRKKQEMRRIQINKLQRNAGFMEEWLQKGVDDWKVNMTKKKEREASQLDFDYTQAEKFNKIVTTKLEDANYEVQNGIAEFEAKLKAMGKSTKVSKEVADKAITQTLSGTAFQPEKTKAFDASLTNNKGAFTLTSTGLKARTKKTLTEETTKQREKRRRRLITAQENLFLDLNQTTRQTNNFEIMKRQSRQEKELDYEVWRTTQCKTIIQENRKLRERQYEKRKELDTETSVVKEEKLIEEMQAASKRSVQEMVNRTAELKQYEREQQVKTRTELCASLMDRIFDIADEAFNHMQDLDSKTWDSRNWHNWTTLFVKDKTINGTLGMLTSGQSTDATEHSNEQLDETELIDYVKNKGEWPTTLITQNKLDLNAVVNPPVEPIAVVGKATTKKAAAVVETTFEPDDLVLKDSAENNFLLGDVIDQLIKLNFDERAKLQHPQTPNWLALKLCLVGYPFSGTNTQAAYIKENYGLDLFKVDQLVQEAIDCSDQPMQGVPEPAEETFEKSSDFADLSEDEAHYTDPVEELRLCGIAIREALLDGQEISDELYVRLFVNKLRMTYKYKTPKAKRMEVKREAQRIVEINVRIQEIFFELAKEDIKASHARKLQAEQKELELEQVKIQQLDNKAGWVLIDFPQSYAQAKLLEQALSGYIPKEELKPTQREQEMKDAELLVQPNPRPQAPATLTPSGIDAIIWLDCPIQECLRRADGRKYDIQQPDQVYHVEDRLPPTNEAPLCEMLRPLSEDNNMVNTLADRFIAFDQTTNSLQRWIKQFGDEDNNRNLLHVINANRPASEIQADVAQHMNSILEQKNEKRCALRDQLASKISHKIAEAKLASEDEMRKAMKTSDSHVSLTPSQHSISPQKPQLTTKLSVAKVDTKTTQKGGSPAASKDDIKIAQALAGTDSNLSKHTTPVPTLPVFERNNLDNDFKPVLVKLWQNLSKKYCNQMKVIFRNVRVQREKQFKNQAAVQRKFLTHLHRLDNKQEILDSFVHMFNHFSDEYPDLREDDSTKEELHQRADVLSDELWEIVEERKDQNVDERKKIMESGDVEFCLDFLTQSAQQLMQAELDKFRVCIQIIHDYYHAIEEKNTPEISSSTTVELAFEGEDIPAVESVPEGADRTQIENYTFPRLEKLLAMAIKHQIIPDVTQIVPGGAAGDKKTAKAATTKKDAVVEIKAIEESLYVKEMKEAIKVEKSILRFRLVQIRNWTYQRLQEYRASSLHMYKKLDDWIYVAQKTEMDAVEEMSVIIKKAIEEEVKIQHELRIKFMDFTVDDATLNYVNPPRPKLEALEEYREDRFSIPQLKTFLTEFETITKTVGDNMQVVELASIFFTKVKNSAHFGGYDLTLPEQWNKLTMPSILSIIRNLDPNNTGFVNWRTLFTYLILLKSEIPSEVDFEHINHENGFAEEADFVNAVFWFDQGEASQDREYSHPFKRVMMIKEMLFRVNQTRIEGGRKVINLGEFARKVCVAKKGACFQDFLFAPVKL